MQTLEDTKTWTEGAVVIVDFPGGPVDFRPAAFLFGTPEGFCWVEPSYADLNGAPSGSLHNRKGAVVFNAWGFSMQCSDGSRIDVFPYDKKDRVTRQDPLEWFIDYLAEQGTTFDAERERVKSLVFSPLA